MKEIHFYNYEKRGEILICLLHINSLDDEEWLVKSAVIILQKKFSHAKMTCSYRCCSFK